MAWQTTPQLDAALNQPNVRFFLAGQLDLPGHTARLLEASGKVTWAQGTFTGEDTLLGTIAAIDAIVDGIGDQAPQLTLKFNPANDADAVEVCSPNMQGSRMRIWLGALDVNGGVVPDPFLMFDGELDQPTLAIDMGTRELTYECVSSFEKLFMNDEGNRLNPAHHKEVWPGETGLDFVTGVSRQVIWGPGFNPENSNGSVSSNPFVNALLGQVQGSPSSGGSTGTGTGYSGTGIAYGGGNVTGGGIEFGANQYVNQR